MSAIATCGVPLPGFLAFMLVCWTVIVVCFVDVWRS